MHNPPGLCARVMLQNMTSQHTGGDLPRSCPGAHKEERLASWVEWRMWEKDQLSLERNPLSWREPTLNIHTPGGMCGGTSSSLESWEEPYGESGSKDNRGPNSCEFSGAISSGHWTLWALHLALWSEQVESSQEIRLIVYAQELLFSSFFFMLLMFHN